MLWKLNDFTQDNKSIYLSICLFIYLSITILISTSVLYACYALAIKYDAEKEERYLQEAKQRELQRIDDALQTAANRGDEQTCTLSSVKHRLLLILSHVSSLPDIVFSFLDYAAGCSFSA